MKKLLLLLFHVIFIVSAYSQLPEYGPAFLQDEVASIRISIDPDTLEVLLSQENWGNDREFPANFSYESTALNEEVSQIGFRLRGNTSLGAAKKSFKISFNTYEEGRKWQNLEKMNLNGSQNDPSMIRAALCWNAIRRAGLPGSRVSFVKLYINEEYRGLYSNIEHIDEEFAELYFPGSQYSTQYKCLYPAPLEFISNNADDYNYFEFNRRPYDQKINDYTADYRDLARFIDVLNHTPQTDFKCNIERVFNVDYFLKYAAIDVLTGNWDGYGYNKNNYYLQMNYHTGQFEFIPYDLDNTLGIDWIGIDWSDRNINTWWNQNEARPLMEKLMQEETYRNRYLNYIQEYAETLLHADTVRNIAEQMMSLIYDAALEDEYRTMDYGFTMEDFEQSLDSSMDNQVKYGIYEFQQIRNNTALSQINALSEMHSMIRGGYFNPFTNEGFAFSESPNSVYIEIANNADFNNSQLVLLSDNGQQPDVIAGDGIHSTVIPNEQIISGNVVYYKFISGENAAVHVWPCSGRKVYRDTLNQNYLNEIMSNNANELVDPEGNYSDWIELYNPYSQSWNTDGYYLTDNPERPNKWAVTPLEINQGMYELIWANSNEDISRYYSNFGISAGGDWLGLYFKVDDHYRLVQYVNVPSLNNNQSLGQFPEGSGNWIVFEPGSSTAAYPNGTAGSENVQSEPFVIYPNPASESLLFNKTMHRILVIQENGQEVMRKENCKEVDLSELQNGIYFLIADKEVRKFILQH